MAGGEVFPQRGASAFVTVVVKHEPGVEPEMHAGGVGPGDGRHLLARTGGQVFARRRAFRWRQDREVSRLVQEIARMGQAVVVDHQSAGLQLDAGQKGARRQPGSPHGQADLFQKRGDFFQCHKNAGEAARAQKAQAPWVR